MRPMGCCAAILICLLWASPISAQKVKREPLTEAQIEQIREAGIDPAERVLLYTKFLDEHAEIIKGLTNRAKSAARNNRLDDELQDFTALMDELGSNLDVYSDRKADIRKPLQPLADCAQRWLRILRALPGGPVFDRPRKKAFKGGGKRADGAPRLLREQIDYFNA